MSAPHSQSEPRYLHIVFAVAVAAALPVAFLTMMFDSIGKDPNGPLLYLAVLLIPALIGFAAHVLAITIDSNLPNPPLALAAVFSLAASMVAFLVAFKWFIN